MLDAFGIFIYYFVFKNYAKVCNKAYAIQPLKPNHEVKTSEKIIEKLTLPRARSIRIIECFNPLSAKFTK